jgi:hypothetical protein
MDLNSADQNDSMVDFFDEYDEFYGNFTELELRQSLRDAAYNTETDTFRDFIAMMVVTISISG